MKKLKEESDKLTVFTFPIIVTTAVPKDTALLVPTPRSEDTSALQLAMHDFERSVLGQKSTTAGRAESPEKLNVVEATKRIRFGKRQYLLGITLHVSGVERRVTSRQTISLDGVLIKNLGMKLATEGRFV